VCITKLKVKIQRNI